MVGGEPQKTPFNLIKSALVSRKVLTHYNPTFPTIVSTNVSNQGIGAVLVKVQEDGQHHPMHCASLILTNAKQRCAVIEKEVIAVTWDSKKFSRCLGSSLCNRNRPQAPYHPTGILGLSTIPPCILRFRLQHMRYTYEMKYILCSAPSRHQ